MQTNSPLVDSKAHFVDGVKLLLGIVDLRYVIQFHMSVHQDHFLDQDSNVPKNARSTTIATRAIAKMAAKPL